MSITEEIQNKMYKRRIEAIKRLHGKSREYWRRKANTKIIKIKE